MWAGHSPGENGELKCFVNTMKGVDVVGRATLPRSRLVCRMPIDTHGSAGASRSGDSIHWHTVSPFLAVTSSIAAINDSLRLLAETLEEQVEQQVVQA